MKCNHCPALCDDLGYEQSATDSWCALGEEEYEYTNGDIGCKRKSLKKIECDLKLARESESKAFAEDCERFVNWYEENNSVVTEK